MAAIPTEPLALYTGLVVALVALFAEGTNSARQYLPLRWTLLGGGIALVFLWVMGGYFALGRKGSGRKRSIPVAELLVAVTAFAAWSLTMPGSPLRTQLHGTITESVATLCITFGGATLVYLAAQFGLTKQVAKTMAV